MKLFMYFEWLSVYYNLYTHTEIHTHDLKKQFFKDLYMMKGSVNLGFLLYNIVIIRTTPKVSRRHE